MKLKIFKTPNFELKPRIIDSIEEDSVPCLVIQNNTLGTIIDGAFSPLNGIMLHFKPDLDAVSAPIILTLLGINFGGIVFCSTGDDGLIEEHTAEEWLKSGWLPIDIGNGQMDHHPAEEHPGICATSLMWEFILSQNMVEDDLRSRIQELVNFVTIRDTKGQRQNMDLAHVCDLISSDLPEQDCYLYMRSIIISHIDNLEGDNTDQLIKVLSEFRVAHPELSALPFLMDKYIKKVLACKNEDMPSILSLNPDKMRDILEVWLIDQKNFFDAEGLLTDATKFRLTNGKYGLFLQTDNKYFLKVALKNGASIIIIKNSRGNVQIFSQKSDKMPVSAIAGLIRHEELFLTGLKMPNDLTTLCAPGGANTNIYFTHNMILNGSDSNPNKKAMSVPISTSIQLIQMADGDYMPACRGRKTECIGSKCKIHFIGGHLPRCIQNFWMP